MKKYIVGIPYYATVFVEVEAENEAEAIKNAQDNCYPSLCAHCSDEVQLDDPDTSTDCTVSLA